MKQATLRAILGALQIDVPVARCEHHPDGGLTLYLYGGEVRHWPPAAVLEIQPEDLSVQELEHLSLGSLRRLAARWQLAGFQSMPKAALRQALSDWLSSTDSHTCDEETHAAL